MKQENINLYHFFSWSNSRGWQHMGQLHGYPTYEECYKDNEFYIHEEPRLLKTERNPHWKIMKLTEVI